MFLFLSPSFFGQRPAFSTQGLEALKVEFWPLQRLEVAQGSWLFDTSKIFKIGPLEAEKSRCKDKPSKIQKYELILPRPLCYPSPIIEVVSLLGTQRPRQTIVLFIVLGLVFSTKALVLVPIFKHSLKKSIKSEVVVRWTYALVPIFLLKSKERSKQPFGLLCFAFKSISSR